MVSCTHRSLGTYPLQIIGLKYQQITTKIKGLMSIFYPEIEHITVFNKLEYCEGFKYLTFAFRVKQLHCH